MAKKKSNKFKADNRISMLLLIFNKLRHPTTTIFLRYEETKLKEMELFEDFLQKTGSELNDFLQNLHAPGFINKHIATPESVAQFYQGHVDAMKMMGIVREIHWRLRQHEDKSSKNLSTAISMLHYKIARTLTIEEFRSSVFKIFSDSVNLQAFTSKLENSYLKKIGGFNKFSRREVVAQLLKTLDKNTPRHLAIRMIGAAVQLEWPKTQIDIGKLQFFMVQIEENIEYIKGNPEKIKLGPDAYMEDFDEIFKATYYKPLS